MATRQRTKLIVTSAGVCKETNLVHNGHHYQYNSECTRISLSKVACCV